MPSAIESVDRAQSYSLIVEARPQAYSRIAGIAGKRAVLAELDRILKPGGILSVWVEHRSPELTRPLITENSRFVLGLQSGDVLNFTRP